MPYSKQHKPKTRRRILDSASQLFPRRGFDAVSIDELMQHAGLTRGAFYHHFKDKADLYAEAILHATGSSPIAAASSNDTATDWLDEILDVYLSQTHIDNADFPCPLAFLVTDIGNRETSSRNAYTRAYARLVDALTSQLETKAPGENRNAALAASALMIGGVAIGRALNDPSAVQALLESCRQTAGQLLRPSENGNGGPATRN